MSSIYQYVHFCGLVIALFLLSDDTGVISCKIRIVFNTAGISKDTPVIELLLDTYTLTFTTDVIGSNAKIICATESLVTGVTNDPGHEAGKTVMLD